MTRLTTLPVQNLSVGHVPAPYFYHNKSTWHIAGIGAVGSLLAGSFCHNGHVVHLILKNEEQLANYQQSKLTVSTDADSYTCHPKAINIDHLGNEPIHYLVCCVKAQDVLKLLKRLKSNLNENSIIILLHNGLGVLDEIKKALPSLRIISGVCTLGAYLEKPFTVRAFLDGALYLGDALGTFTDQEIKAILDTFQRATIPIQWKENIQPKLWEKFALNCSVNLLTALLSCKNGDLLLHVKSLKQVTAEVAQVISAYGMNISATDLLLKVTMLLEKVGNNYSSMYKDVQQHRPTELPYLNEHLVKLAEQKQIPTPFNSELLNQFYAKFPRQ